MEIRFRKASQEDLNILAQIHTQNMRDYVAINYPWDSNLFIKNFHYDDYSIVQNRQEIIGFLKIVSEENALYLGEIQIKHTYQNQGIGTKILQYLIDDNRLSCRRIWLQVLKGNPAIRFYSRLGFKVFTETKTHYKMQITFL